MPGPINRVEKPKNAKKSVRNFLKSLKPWRFRIIVGLVLATISSLLSIFGPKLLGDMTNSAMNSFQKTGHIDWVPIIKIATKLIILYISSGILGYLQEILFGILTARYTKDLRTKILEKINRLPVSYFDKHKYGDILSRMSNDVDVLSNLLAGELTQIISSVVTLLGTIIIMITISLPLSFIAIITVPISLIFSRKVLKHAQKYFISRQNTLGKLNSIIEEDYSGQIIIKSNSHENESLKTFQMTNNKLAKESEKSEFLSRLVFPLTHIFTNLSYIIICIVGGFSVIASKITIGELQSFIQYVSRFNRPLTNLSDITANLQLTIAASERIFGFLHEDEELEEDNLLEITSPKGLVEFKNVSFSYDKAKQIIKDFSAKINPGNKVAIVGPTGAGKTTLINLLMRFYDPNSGQILIDNTPSIKISRNNIRKLFGMVLQDTWLFSGTIEENLRYGNPKASLTDIKKATKIASIDHFIESLPEGYSTIISEDSDNISAGEKQLLTIARAMVANPPMIILDEATSNVDTRTEQLIQSAFDELTKNRTSFIIAHRLSTIRNADLIIVINNGEIVEQGTHKSLLNKNGFYAELYNSQFTEA